MNNQKYYCGIDVSSETLDCCYQTADGNRQHLQVTNNKKGFAQLLKICEMETHFVMEATGVYHMNLMFYLYEKGKGYSVVNALQIKRYIQMHLERNKSDQKDAKRICDYGIDRQPEPTQMPDSEYFECRSINQTIHDMTKAITKMSNQLHALKRSGIAAKEVMKSLEKLIKNMREEQAKLSVVLEDKLAAWQPELVAQVQSVKGIGKRAASELIIYTQSFKGMESYKQLISYCGLSPVEYSLVVVYVAGPKYVNKEASKYAIFCICVP
jgi:transposase